MIESITKMKFPSCLPEHSELGPENYAQVL